MVARELCDKEIRDLLVKKATKKFKPWFSPLCFGFMPMEEKRKIWAEMAKNNKNWSEALEAIDALLEQLGE